MDGITRAFHDLIGRTAGSYRIEARIGAGGMGEVYRAHDLKLQRPVALKLLGRELARDPDRLRRFRSEALAASSLNHPHILVIHDFGELDDQPFIVSELVEGETLRQRIDRGPLAVAAAVEIAIQVASALSAAHARGIVHRDVKPENIMLRPDGYVKVLDFGLAKLIGGDSADDRASVLHTQPGVVMGTPRYMSPEQARGLETDARTDVWSLGVVLYEMLAGRPPFAGATNADVVAAIVSTEPLPLDVVAPHVPENVARVAATALRKLRDERYADASDAHAALIATRRDIAPEPAGGRAAASVPRAGRQPTVGRDRERAELAAALRRVEHGCGLVLSVSGEAGSGKTTLVESFIDAIPSLGLACRVARGRCSERLAGSEAYLPVLEAVESLLHSGDSTARRVIAEVAPAWHAQVTTATSSANLGTRPAEAPAGSQERLKRELAALLRELSRREPLVLFLEDVHWADASTVDALAYLAARFSDLRVLVIVTSRPSDLLLAHHPFASLRQDLQARRLCHELSLEMLTRDDVHHYLSLQFPAHAFPPELAGLIHAKTEGSPLFMADLVRYLAANGTLRQDAQGRWNFDGALDTVGRELPESVRGMIERKIAQVSDEDRALLTAASVQGYEFDSTVLAHVLKRDPAEVEERLETLERVHRFVRLIDEREFPDGMPTLHYQFAHVLYQNALYGQLRGTRRATLSAAVAQTLVQAYGARHAEVASQLAPLFEAARDWLRAADYYALAARHAAKLFASRESVVLATRGVGVLQKVPESSARHERELALQVTLGNALIATRGYASDEVLQTYTRARDLCERLGATPHFNPVVYGFAAFYLVGGQHPTALRYGTELLRLTEQQNDPALVVGHRMVGWPLLAMGRLAEARQHFEIVDRMYDPAVHSALSYVYGHDPGMAARVMLSLNCWLQGDLELARRYRNSALEVARHTAHANSQCYALNFAAFHQQMEGDFAAAHATADALLKIAEEQGLALWLGWGATIRGYVVAVQKDSERGLAELRTGIEAARRSGSQLMYTYHLGLLADALVHAGRYDEAVATLDEADTFAATNEERFWIPELQRLRGLIALAAGDLERAHGLFAEGLAVAAQQSAHSLAARLQASQSHARS